MMKSWMRGVAMTGLASLLAGGAVLGQAANPAQAPAQPAQANAANPGHARGDLPGPIDSPKDLQDTAKMLFKLADTNNDGQISQKEAEDAGDLLVGGFFFRADTNGDGVLTKEEARAAREALFQQQPLLRYVVTKAKSERQNARRNQTREANPKPNANNANQANANASRNPVRGLASLLDSNNDKQIQATEVRQAVQNGVQGLFAAADTNRDGQLSPTELNAAMIGMARAAAQAAYQNADTDRNGAISMEEFDKALTERGHMVFAVMDTNNDGQLSPDEFRAARDTVINQVRALRVPTAANAPSNLIRTGTAPDQVAPVPNLGTNRNANAPANPGQAPPPR
jgi:Ca2+-binding EF-hand superfamily protein